MTTAVTEGSEQKYVPVRLAYCSEKCRIASRLFSLDFELTSDVTIGCSTHKLNCFFALYIRVTVRNRKENLK
jgi:hypothetical protein